MKGWIWLVLLVPMMGLRAQGLDRDSTAGFSLRVPGLHWTGFAPALEGEFRIRPRVYVGCLVSFAPVKFFRTDSPDYPFEIVVFHSEPKAGKSWNGLVSVKWMGRLSGEGQWYWGGQIHGRQTLFSDDMRLFVPGTRAFVGGDVLWKVDQRIGGLRAVAGRHWQFSRHLEADISLGLGADGKYESMRFSRFGNVNPPAEAPADFTRFRVVPSLGMNIGVGYSF